MKIKNLFIIGNGFDLAHGLKTDYKSFLFDYLLKERLNIGPVKDSSLRGNIAFERELKMPNGKQLYTENVIISVLFKHLNISDWVDIESIYFKMLTGGAHDIKKLNNDLLILKNELEGYLEKVSEFKNKIHLSSFFEKISKKKESSFMVLNFNYTNTFDLLYKSAFENCNVTNIHGQLKDSDNPIIFGYAPTNEETKDLIKKGNNELLKNIKRYYYKRTDSELQLNQFLNDSPKNDIHVHILGHSCGVSDRNILKNIFVNENVKEISIMYHNNYDNYFDTLVNIDRVVENNEQYGIINNFKNSIRMPQFNDKEEMTTKTLTMIDYVTKIKKINRKGVDIR